MNGSSEPELVFYDGDCGLCRRSARFLAGRDREGVRFRFEPLRGEVFRRVVPADAAARLPDSMVVRTRDGTLLVRSAAMWHALRRLGSGWTLLAAAGSLVPRPWADWAYDRIAASRSSCPVHGPGPRAR